MGSNGHRTSLCCKGLKCEPMLGSFDMRCVDKPTPAPTPAPTRNTCKEIGCGSQGKSDDECECIEECLLRGTCCSDFISVCKSVPTLPPTPQPAPTPAPTPVPTYIDGDYVVYNNMNAYAPYGAVDIDTDATAPTGLTAHQCEARCTDDPECMCVTQEQQGGKCWKRKDCDPSQWTSDFNQGYNVYMKLHMPSPDGDYIVYTDKNAYAPYGAVDIDTDATAPEGLTSNQCEARCTADPACMCATLRRDDGKCWKRKDCVPSQWTSDYNAGYNVYLKLGSR